MCTLQISSVISPSVLEINKYMNESKLNYVWLNRTQFINGRPQEDALWTLHVCVSAVLLIVSASFKVTSFYWINHKPLNRDKCLFAFLHMWGPNLGTSLPLWGQSICVDPKLFGYLIHRYISWWRLKFNCNVWVILCKWMEVNTSKRPHKDSCANLWVCAPIPPPPLSLNRTASPSRVIPGMRWTWLPRWRRRKQDCWNFEWPWTAGFACWRHLPKIPSL